MPQRGAERRADLWDALGGGAVRCRLCAHRCTIEAGARGTCGVRENRGGELHTLVYGRLVAEHPNPAEMKPFYHFHPGSLQHSIATAGCNLRCAWCQNWEISQMPREEGRIGGVVRGPQQVVAAAVAGGCQAVSYTFTEPTVFFELARDTALLAREAGLANTFVTNGYFTGEALHMAADWLDAASVDLKAFREETYRRWCGARLEPVLDSLRGLRAAGIWVEVTTLVVPGINDDLRELADLARFVVEELGPATPWHLSRFHPAYRFTDRPPTPVETLQRARALGLSAGLRYVYLGNVPGEQNTLCPACGALLVRRSRRTVIENRVAAGGRCPTCGEPVDGVGMAAEG
ncbi:MAG: AmmeMemoRadiSam system radical SAM enzyme [Armatimonadota bacterium]